VTEASHRLTKRNGSRSFVRLPPSAPAPRRPYAGDVGGHVAGERESEGTRTEGEREEAVSGGIPTYTDTAKIKILGQGEEGGHVAAPPSPVGPCRGA